MKKSIELLVALEKADLEKYKAENSCPNEITTFVKQSSIDVKRLYPSCDDAIKFADNVLEALYSIHSMYPDVFQQESVDKIVLIYEIYLSYSKHNSMPQNEVNDEMRCLDVLSSNILTIHRQGIEGTKEYLIKQHMSNILSILKEEKPNYTALIQAYTDLGLFLRTAFPGMLVPAIKKTLKEFPFPYEINTDIPHLELYSAIMYATPRVYDEVADDDITKDVSFMGSLTRGIEVFAHLEKIGGQVDEILPDEGEIKKASNAIIYLLPTNVNARANETLVQYEKSCNAYLFYLHGIINTKASENIMSEYNSSNTLEESEEAANTIRAHFKKQPRKLAAFEKYKVMKEGQTILRSDDFSVQRVEKFKAHLLQNKPTLTKRRDSFFMTFVKGLGVLGAALVGLQRFACHSFFGENATHGGKLLKDVIDDTPGKRFKYHG